MKAPIPASAIELDSWRRAASVAGEELYLSDREFTLLAALVAEPGRGLTYEELLGETFAGAPGVGRGVLDATADRLRRKLELRGAGGLVVACGEGGYRLSDSIEPACVPGHSPQAALAGGVEGAR